MYKWHLCIEEYLDDVLDAIDEQKDLRLVSCFCLGHSRVVCIMTEVDDKLPLREVTRLSDSRKVCLMTEQNDRQPVDKIIQRRKTRVKQRKLWQKR
jgi:hypothetical protein